MVLEAVEVARLDVSAASGLVALQDRLCVIADDETFLAIYAPDGTPTARVPLLSRQDRDLPRDHAARKRRKPDFEALALLPTGDLLALGSGSTASRARGALVAPRAEAVARPVDLAPLYARLARDIPDLNVEGAAVSEDALWLLQRGNGAAGFNACIELDLARVLSAVERGAPLEASMLRSVTHVTLGTLDDVPLSFTDAVSLPGGALLFCAAAEATTDTYADGPCAGSIVGVLEGNRVVESLRVHPTHKIEGIALDALSRTLWLVADPDDRRLPAALLRARFAPSRAAAAR